MPSALTTVRAHLAARYQTELGQTLLDGYSAANGAPVWRCVQADDLRSPADASAKAVAGVLLDSELGLVLFVIPYVKGCAVSAQASAAASLQSSLHPMLPPIPPPDEFGAWQVAIHWLVEESDRDSWEAQIVQLRQHTGCAEELVFDAVFYLAGELEARLVEHGLPRLLLTARRVLAQTGPGETAKWLSADYAVLRELENFPEPFTDPEQRRRAELVQDQVGEVVLTAPESEPDAPRELSSLEVRDFRNLGHLRLHFGLAPVSCRVIFGPNGTGKTSLFEALCLGLYHSSARHQKFLGERDLAARDRGRLYSGEYLASLTSPDRSPQIALNGEEAAPPRLVETREEADRAALEFSGNLLAQETSREFLDLSADELAIRVLAGYSVFAEKLEAYVEECVEQATQRRQTFLRGLGLPAAITKVETALSRIAEQLIERELPPPSAALLAWLDQLAELPQMANEIGTLRADWRQWSDPAERSKLADQLARSPESEATCALEDWITQSNQLIVRTRTLLERLDDRLAPLREHFEETLRDLTVWGEWLERGPLQSQPKASPTSEVEALRRQLSEVQAAQQKAMKAGQVTRQHLDHLDQVMKLLAQGLGASEPSKCPTCGAAHPELGGVARVVGQLRDEVAAARENLLRDYRTLEEKAKALQRSLQERGETPCPLAKERQATLPAALGWLLASTPPTLESQLRDPALRSRLLHWLRTLQTPPPLAGEANARDEAQRILLTLTRQTTEARDSFYDQDHWKPVQAAFRKKLAKVVAEHLPATLERLWMELTMNLTSAPWLLPARPVFEVVVKRGQRQASVRLGNRLARYILNQAETHLLGLGWFFTRYLTHGRFRGRFLVMDDPAQQLDETSYRDLCRLWRVLVRLHAVRRHPLRLVLFLHQEGRALAAARATNGLVNTLGWAREQQGELREVELFAPSAKPSHPNAWFQAEAAVA